MHVQYINIALQSVSPLSLSVCQSHASFLSR